MVIKTFWPSSIGVGMHKCLEGGPEWVLGPCKDGLAPGTWHAVDEWHGMAVRRVPCVLRGVCRVLE